ncbi:MAG: divalent metal cation transporter [bacterium]|nr:divalent metal cation transporter [bacterium]
MSNQSLSLKTKLQAVGPGILFAGAAIGVSHLVQATRAGASYGFDLLWAVILVLIFKYPFFQYAHRYTVATGESLLEGYQRQGRWALLAFMIVVVISSFITLAAVTVVTAGLASGLLGLSLSLGWVSFLVLAFIGLILLVGRYGALDRLMKVMVLVLGALTLISVAMAFAHGPAGDPNSTHPDVFSVVGLTFMLALMGWMPAPLEIGAWSSLWVLEKNKSQSQPPTMFQAMIDFNLGYVATVVLALAFVSFGALVMFGTGTEFSPKAVRFSTQLVHMFTQTLGGWSHWVIATVAFITMFSTTLTVLDGYSRTLAVGLGLLSGKKEISGRRPYVFFLFLLAAVSLMVITNFVTSMKSLIDVVTILAFLTAPLVAVLNLRAVKSDHVPKEHQPGTLMTVFSWAGIVFLVGFGVLWLVMRWIV